MDEVMQCPECKGMNLIKAGKSWSGRTKVQRYQCKDCGRIITKVYEENLKEEIQ